MNKNIILAVLAILLAASIGWAWFLQQEKNKLQEGMKTLEVEKTALQNKIEKGLFYAKALDMLLEPVRKQASLPTRQNLSDAEWLSAFTAATKSTADTQLQSNVNDIKLGGDIASRATVLFMEHSVSSIVDALK